MKMTLIILIFILTTQSVFADEAPSYVEFKINSSNGNYIAWIVKTDTNSLTESWDAKWTIKVFQTSNHADSLLIWTANYQYDGYPGGILSNDGTTYAYLSFWFFENYSVVKIYQNGKLTVDLKGKYFKIPKSALEETESHEVWLSYEHRIVEFILIDNKELSLKIITIDDKEHIIDCSGEK